MYPPSPRRPQLRTPTHLSHSARETLSRCAKSYFLRYLAGAPQRPALWSAAGTAVHEVTEAYDRATIKAPRVFDVEANWSINFRHQLDKIRAKEPNEGLWRRTAAEGLDEWNALGPTLIQSYIDWRVRSPWEIWTTPDGEPAIELDVSGRLPGCEPEIKAYLDRVFWDPVFKKLWVFDLKSGKRAPTTPDQFGTYSALTEVKYGVPINDGVAFLNRRSELGRAFDLSGFTPEFTGLVFTEAWEQVQRGEFEANGFPGACFICDVQAACHVQNGPLAALYDPSSPNYPPPF